MSKEEGEAIDHKFETILNSLPKEKDFNDTTLCLYQGFWVPDFMTKSLISMQNDFIASDNDIILTSCPKSGTTWLKALVFTIVNRTCADDFSLKNSPLLEKNPHTLVKYLEDVNVESIDQCPHSSPRVLSTHVPYESLPHSIRVSNCKIVYIYRNPIDLFISLWHFSPKLFCKDVESDSLEWCFDRFCRGIHLFGPFWDHVLGFWEASLERPENILILCYEDLKKDPFCNAKKLAEFLGFPFSQEEEKRGVIGEIIAFCSFGSMKNLEVNKSGISDIGIPYNAFFRKGEVGDSKNFLTPTMIERLENLITEKYVHFPQLSSNISISRI